MSALFGVPKNMSSARWLSFGIGCLPPLIIFGAGFVWPMDNTSSEIVKGRPAGFVFGIVWTLLTMIWVVAIFLASIHFSPVSLTLVQLFSNFALILAVTWLYLYNSRKDKSAAAQVILLNTLFAFLAVVSGATAESEHKLAPQAVSLLFSPLFVWLTGATMFNYLEINSLGKPEA